MSKYYLLLLIIFLTVVIGLIVNKFTKEHFFVERRKDVQKYIDNRPRGNFWWDRYKKYNSEVNYLNDVHTSNFFGKDNDLLILNRCIRRGGWRRASNMYQLKDRFNRYLNRKPFFYQFNIFDVNSEKDIQEKIIKRMKEFYDKRIKKDSDGTKTLNGPVYVLLHNAPNKDTSKKSRLLMYILYPTYNKKGEFVFKNWENVRCNMEWLLNHWHHRGKCYTNIGNSNLPGGCTNLNKPYKNRCGRNLTYGMLYTVNTSSDALKVIAGKNAIKNTVNIHSHFLSRVRPKKEFRNNCRRINKNPNKKVNSVPVQKYVDDRLVDVFYYPDNSRRTYVRRKYTHQRYDDKNSNDNIYKYFILHNPSKFAIKLYSDNNLKGNVRYLVGRNTNTPQKLEVPNHWKGKILSYEIIPRKDVPKYVVNIKIDNRWIPHPQSEWPFADGIGKAITDICIYDKKSVIRLYEKPNFKGRSYPLAVGARSYRCTGESSRYWWHKNVGSFKIYPR